MKKPPGSPVIRGASCIRMHGYDKRAGGEGGIRTHVTAHHRKLAFEASAFNRSATSPQGERESRDTPSAVKGFYPNTRTKMSPKRAGALEGGYVDQMDKGNGRNAQPHYAQPPRHNPNL